MLSRFVGCAALLRGVLVVHPCDVYHVADTLRAVLTMSLDEGIACWQEAFGSIRSHDGMRWRDRLLARVAGAAGAAERMRARWEARRLRRAAAHGRENGGGEGW